MTDAYLLHATGTDGIIMSVQRAADGRWCVIADGNVVEDGFTSRGSATRYVLDRSDLDDREMRSMVMRASPRQRTIMREMLDEIDGGGA